MRGFVGMDLIMIILNEKQGWLLFFFFHTIFSLELPGLDNQDLIEDYCYDYIEIFMTI